MKYIFQTTDPQEAKEIMLAPQMYNILFELKFNFWRRWKNKDPKNGNEILNALQQELSDIHIT